MGPDVLIRAFKDELNSDNEIIRVTVPEDKPKGLDGKVFNNEIEMFEEIGILGGWYIKKARKETVEFLIEK